MRFNCDKEDKRKKWHMWFAWRPVKFYNKNEWVWLEYVDRKGIIEQIEGHEGESQYNWHWKYKDLESWGGGCVPPPPPPWRIK